MSRFKRMLCPDFAEEVMNFGWKRRINEVHFHHTWRPNHDQWKGEASMKGMYHHHVVNNGWSDMAQHLTIDPTGGLWIGRNWNKAPASSRGRNGNRRRGPFMVEVVGDFDKGRDTLGGDQLNSVCFVFAYLLDHFSLPTKAIRFHCEFSTKTCPGSAIDRKEFLAYIDVYRTNNGLTDGMR